MLDGTLVRKREYRLGDPIIAFTLTPSGNEDLYVLKWYTPLEGLRSKVLIANAGCIEVPYEGPLMKRTLHRVTWLSRQERRLQEKLTSPVGPTYLIVFNTKSLAVRRKRFVSHLR
jgi:hypothetical protein